MNFSSIFHPAQFILSENQRLNATTHSFNELGIPKILPSASSGMNHIYSENTPTFQNFSPVDAKHLNDFNEVDFGGFTAIILKVKCKQGNRR